MQIGTLAPVSNKEDWIEDREVIDIETGEAVSLASVDEITIAVRDPETLTIKLTGTLTGGEIALIDSGMKFEWTFRASSMNALDPKTYEVGCILVQDEDTRQVLIGFLPVLDGVTT